MAVIPSHHDQYLALTRELGVSLEVLVNSSRSNFLPNGADRVRLRQVTNDLRGHLSALLEKALRSGALDQELSTAVREKLAAFLKGYGDLSDDLSYGGSQRVGLAKVPGATIEQAIAVPPLTLDELLANPQLSAVLFDENILMQPTMLQPAGGMDRLPAAIAAALRNPPRLNAEVREIRLVVMMYVRFPLSLRNVEDLLFERGIDICHETVRHW